MNEEKKQGPLIAFGHALLAGLHQHYRGTIGILLVVGGLIGWVAYIAGTPRWRWPLSIPKSTTVCATTRR